METSNGTDGGNGAPVAGNATPADTAVVTNPEAAGDPIAAKLSPMGVSAEAIDKIKTVLGVATVDDLAVLQVADLTGIGMAVVPARKVIAAFAAPVAPEPVQAAAITPSAEVPVVSTLDQLPPDQSLLESLRVGGVLRVENARVVMAGRCLFAKQIGMYGLDARLMRLINKHYTDEVLQPNPQIFWELDKARTRTRYATVFNALDMPGAGKYATRAARQAFWDRMNQIFIPRLVEVQRQLTTWYETWVKQAQANVGINLGAALGGPGMARPAMRIPPIIPIVGSVDALVDSINKVFAGENEVVAIALAVDAQRLRELLKRDDVHFHTGASTKEIMLRSLGVEATSDVIMMENAFSMYLHNVMRVQSMPSTGMTTCMFLQELQETGANIDWDRLSRKVEISKASSDLSGIGKGRRRVEPDDEEPLDDDDEQ